MPIDSAFLAEIELLSSLDEEERSVLAASVTSTPMTAGQRLFRAGDEGDSMFIVRSGAVELSVNDVAGQKIVLHTARPGTYFGELSLLDGGSRSATADVIEDGELLVLDRGDLQQLFEKRPHAALHMLANIGAMTRRADALLQQRVARNVNEEIEEHSTLLQLVADGISAFSGSMAFLLLNVGWFLVSIVWNTISWFEHYDPFPFGLLTMIVSLEAIFLSCFVLISQNRQSAKDRVRSDIEYEINVKAELEVAHLHEKTDRIQEDMVKYFTRLEKTLAARK